jgi:hypothetical protein
MSTLRFLALATLSWLVLPLASWAHHDPSARVPSLRAVKISEAATVDGVLDEPFWQKCPPGTDMLETRTQEKAVLPTVVRLAHNRTFLFVAVECFDDRMEEIRASERREDRSFTGDDWVEIHFDPMHRHQGKYAFYTNPLGTRAEGNEGPSGVFNYGWTAEWTVATRQLADRWVIEMRIPFSIMNYERRNQQTWGFNVTRVVRRTDSTSFWSFSPTDSYKPCHFGHLTGLDLADTTFDRNWEITPYASARADFNGRSHTLMESGMDVSFRLTPSVSTAWTYNPDFGQVEADDDTIELRDTERFLSEKRLFFREGEDLMRQSQQLYYSRRFTDIEGGAKITGQMRSLSYSFLDIQGDHIHDGNWRGNSAVLRMVQNVHDRSNLGYYLSDSELELGHSRVAGLDSTMFLTDTWRCNLQATLADDRRERASGAPLKDREDYLASSTLIYRKYPWEFDFGYLGISRDFNPLLGYIPRRNIFGPTFLADYTTRSDSRWYKEISLTYDTQYFENQDGRKNLQDHSVDSDLIFRNDVAWDLGHDQDYHAPWSNRHTHSGFTLYNSDYWRSASLHGAVGSFEGTDYHQLTLGKPLKPLERLPIRYEITVRKEDKPPGMNDIVWLNRVVFDLFLSDDMWVKTSLQHRNHGLHNISVIYGWERLWRRTNWYVVLNELKTGSESVTSLFTKVTYTF